MKKDNSMQVKVDANDNDYKKIGKLETKWL